MGSLAIGPVVWGSIAEFTSLPASMLVASVGLTIVSLFSRRWPISGNDLLDHTPSRHWRKPEPAIPVEPHHGPVMIKIRYEEADANRKKFLEARKQLSLARRRDGATFWQIFADATAPGSYIEMFVVNTWLDHLRQHERTSRQDAQVQERIKTLLQPDTSPVVTQFVHPAA